MTERTKCNFIVKENEHGSWILVEEYEPGLPVLGEGKLSLEFREKTSVEEAQETAEFLRERFDKISFTGPPWK